MNCTSLEYPRPYFFSAPAGFDTRDRAISAAVVFSLLIHGIALGWLPGLRGPLAEVSQKLQIHLAVPATRPEPAPVAQVVASPTSPGRRESYLPRPQALPALTRSVEVAALSSVHAIEPAPPESNELPRPRPAPLAVPPPHLDGDLLAGYGRELAGAVARHQRYPRLALLRQWQGSAMLRLEFGADSRLLAVRVLSSSGYEALDQQALEMVRAASPLPQLPAALAGQPISVDVPVVFKITS